MITVPDGVSLRKVDLAVELQILYFYQQRRAAGRSRRPSVTGRPARPCRSLAQYPVNLSRAAGRCLVVGGGRSPPGRSAACSTPVPRARRGAGGRRRVRASDRRGSPGRRAAVPRGDLAGCRLVVTATDDPAVNRRGVRRRRGGTASG